jgi:hypothetical protein
LKSLRQRRCRNDFNHASAVGLSEGGESIHTPLCAIYLIK